MDDKEWDLVVAVHLKGAYEMTKACWPLFRGQKVSSIPLLIPCYCSIVSVGLKRLFGWVVWTGHQHFLGCGSVWKPGTDQLFGL